MFERNMAVSFYFFKKKKNNVHDSEFKRFKFQLMLFILKCTIKKETFFRCFGIKEYPFELNVLIYF